MKNTKRINYQKGTTMIELLIYLAIFMLVMSILIQVLSGTFGIFAKVRATRGLTVAGSSIVERISHNVRAASSFSITGNNFGTNLGSLSLEIEDSAGVMHTYLYTVNTSNYRIMEQIDSGAQQYLNSAGQTVSSFTVNQITAGAISGAVITLTLTDNRIYPSKSATFSTTALMRGNY